MFSSKLKTQENKDAKRVNDETIESQIDYIIDRGLNSNRGRGWTVEKKKHPAFQDKVWWVFRYDLIFQKTSGHVGGTTENWQWDSIQSVIAQCGHGTKYGEYPWEIISPSNEITLEKPQTLTEIISDLNKAIIEIPSVKNQTTLSSAKTWEDLSIPSELLGIDSNKYLAQHPAWCEIYGLEPQIRTILSNIKRAKDTQGKSRNHCVLYGTSGGGKSTTILALQKMFGTGSYLKLDATSTTKAGLEKLFFYDLKDQLIPPLVFMEEAEKANEEALKIWLGALDDRGEIRKVNFRENQLRRLNILFICNVNNKVLFDKMMASNGSDIGALSSRCSTQIYFPKPNEEILKRILQKEIHNNGGNESWISPAIQLAQKLNITDPRIVKSYLSGGDRLLDGSYQRDWMIIEESSKKFNGR